MRSAVRRGTPARSRRRNTLCRSPELMTDMPSTSASSTGRGDSMLWYGSPAGAVSRSPSRTRQSYWMARSATAGQLPERPANDDWPRRPIDSGAASADNAMQIISASEASRRQHPRASATSDPRWRSGEGTASNALDRKSEFPQVSAPFRAVSAVLPAAAVRAAEPRRSPSPRRSGCPGTSPRGPVRSRTGCGRRSSTT